MKITVEINIDDDLIQAAADSSARSLFRLPKYGDRTTAPGYARILEQVEDVVRGMDYATVARETAAKFAKGIIEDVTKEQIKRMAKEVVKIERDAGTLLL